MLGGKKTSSTNIWAFSFPLPDGGTLPLADYRGKVVLVVNTASECGFTSQYKDLQVLYERYQDKGLTVIAVPSNDFGAQEPGTNEQICAFTRDNYHITFPVTAKQAVKGPNAHPFYQRAGAEAGIFGSPKWNFYKYLIGKDGRMVDWFTPFTDPLDIVLTRTIEVELVKA